jgi:hypothetical protein
MSAGSVLSFGDGMPGLGRRPPATGPEPFAPHSAGLDPVDVLAEEFAMVCAGAVDADEVAVALEACGLGDRIAMDTYGQRDVFALAEELLARVPRRAASPLPPPRPTVPAGRQVLLRSMLYLTPLVLAMGAAQQLAGIPGWVTAGALVAGWSAAQGLAYLGYLVGGRGGDVRAARFLLVGFTALAALWTAALVGTSGARLGSQPGGLAGAIAVSLVELALFAAVTVALVTGRERELVRAAVPSWIASGALVAGRVLLDGPSELHWVGAALLAGTVGRFLFVAYRPVLGPSRRDDWRWSLHLTEAMPALGYAAVGAAQAVLLVAAMMAGAGADADAGTFGAGMPLITAPLLIGALAAEYLLLRHRVRLEHALDTATDRTGYRRQLLRAICGTLGLFTLGIVAGLAVAANWGATDPVRGLQLVCGVLLAGHSVVTLLLLAHRRLGLATVLVGGPALFVVSAAIAVARFGMVPPQPGQALSYAAAVLGTALALGYLAAVRVLPFAPVRP